MARERTSKVVFGKVTISNWAEGSIEERMRELLESGYEFLQKKHKGKDKYVWVIGDKKEQKINGETVLFARLGKINRRLIEKEYDRKTKSFITIERERPTVGNYSNFIFHPKSQSILFEEKRPEISIWQFRENLSNIYLYYFNDFTKLYINFIQEVGRVFELIKSCDKIIYAKFNNLRPSNPEMKKQFKRLDNLFREAKIKNGNLEFRNEDGIKVEKTIVGEAIHLSSAGYGDFNVIGEKGDRKKFIKSRDKIKRRVEKIIDEPEEVIKKYYRLLKKEQDKEDENGN